MTEDRMLSKKDFQFGLMQLCSSLLKGERQKSTQYRKYFVFHHWRLLKQRGQILGALWRYFSSTTTAWLYHITGLPVSPITLQLIFAFWLGCSPGCNFLFPLSVPLQTPLTGSQNSRAWKLIKSNHPATPKADHIGTCPLVCHCLNVWDLSQKLCNSCCPHFPSDFPSDWIFPLSW